MKKFNWKLLTCACLGAALLSGCAGGPNTPATLPAIDEKPVAVESTVANGITTAKELAAAIVPGATVELGEGTILLEPENGDLQTGNSFCRWESVGDGYQMVIANVQNVTIRGAGQGKTVLQSEPRAATVLNLQNCENVVLEGFTAGHTERTDPCEGNVINLNSCTNVTMKDLGLYGCGAVGVNSYECNTLSLERCEIYECSSVGLELDYTNEVTVTDCVIRDIGGDLGGSNALTAWWGSGLKITNTTFQGNNCCDLMNIGQRTVFTGCKFEDNTMSGSFLTAYNAGELTDVVLDDCTGKGNTGWTWFTLDGGVAVVDATGAEITEAQMDETFGPLSAEVKASTTAQETVTVKTTDEFLAALDSNREIIIDTPLLDLSTASDYGKNTDGVNYYWVDNFDGPQLNIVDLDNVTIRGKSGKGANVISAVPRYANVLYFQNCTNITVEDLTAGHTKEPGYCMGGVLYFDGCGNATVEGTGLFGCGTIGIQGVQCRNLALNNNEIYECSYGGINLNSCKKAEMNGNTFRDIGDKEYNMAGFVYNFTTCSDLTFDGAAVPGDDYLEYNA